VSPVTNGLQVTPDLLHVSAVTVSIFGFAVGFGRFLKIRTAIHGSVSAFIVPDFNHVQSKH